MHKGMGHDRLHPPALDPGSALFLDVDGTLLEIAAAPDLVQVPAGLPDLLGRRAAERDGAVTAHAEDRRAVGVENVRV